MSNKENVDIEISEAKESNTPETSDDKLMKVLEAIDWKLWEMLKIMQSWDEEEQKSDD
jgi:hypothetical protein|tara:strand:+ start:371 stop:544 length:174 start_codon:yes stop_codon:yes gene_type:complete